MSRKNNRAKFRRIHKANLANDQNALRKFESSLKKSFTRTDNPEDDNQADEQEWEDQSDNDMQIEKEAPKLKKIKKNKLIQRRTVKVEKKRLRKARQAPILVQHNVMDLE